MEKNQPLNKKEKSLAKEIIPHIVNSLHQEGVITEEDLKDKMVLLKKVDDYLSDEKNQIDFKIFIDHRQPILKFAKAESENGNTGLSTTLYATYVEHTLNRFIHLVCIEKGFDNKTQSEIIRSVSISAKCTWVIKLLGLPPIRQEHIKTILQIADERNSFIHYKWKPESDETQNLSKIEEVNIERDKKIKSLLRYLKNYEAKLEFKGNKSRFDIL
ncbi:hypothetical protein QWY90_03265 [Flavobacterium paronense]|uniref:RiboL-PSP-HEPN domain-containing protein n=1 Tax=Flavobacterium paronense TaxID=1392775 RepID=A0ABV5GHE3_9FLAO|nr:hypothetical protein [Flavobacterium paronense]MDN3676327.1 hypothetical protein [Flavobacterium paronense]